MDGKNMGRAFREGVSPGRRVVTIERDQRFELAISEGRLSHLWKRATRSNRTKQEKIEVPAMLTIEDDQWVWQQVSPEVLVGLTHRLVVPGDKRGRTLGCTADFKTAHAYANHMAITRGQVVLIERLDKH